jgi:hypothetical protein
VAGHWFLDLFTPASIKLRTFLNYGLAAIFYLVVGGILSRVARDLWQGTEPGGVPVRSRRPRPPGLPPVRSDPTR